MFDSQIRIGTCLVLHRNVETQDCRFPCSGFKEMRRDHLKDLDKGRVMLIVIGGEHAS